MISPIVFSFPVKWPDVPFTTTVYIDPFRKYMDQGTKYAVLILLFVILIPVCELIYQLQQIYDHGHDKRAVDRQPENSLRVLGFPESRDDRHQIHADQQHDAYDRRDLSYLFEFLLVHYSSPSTSLQAPSAQPYHSFASRRIFSMYSFNCFPSPRSPGI